jgi:hypothetical protein
MNDIHMEQNWTGHRPADQRGKRGFGSDIGLDGRDGSDSGFDSRPAHRMASGLRQSDFLQHGKPDLRKPDPRFRIGFLLRGEQGSAIINGLYTMLMIMICFCVGVDIVGYGSMAWKLRNACTETLALIKIENGFDDHLNLKFQEFLTVQGMDPNLVQAEGTPKLVQLGDLVEIHAETTYTLRALRPLGHSLEAPIQVTLRGLAQDYIRR